MPSGRSSSREGARHAEGGSPNPGTALRCSADTSAPPARPGFADRATPPAPGALLPSRGEEGAPSASSGPRFSSAPGAPRSSAPRPMTSCMPSSTGDGPGWPGKWPAPCARSWTTSGGSRGAGGRPSSSPFPRPRRRSEPGATTRPGSWPWRSPISPGRRWWISSFAGGPERRRSPCIGKTGWLTWTGPFPWFPAVRDTCRTNPFSSSSTTSSPRAQPPRRRLRPWGMPASGPCTS